HTRNGVAGGHRRRHRRTASRHVDTTRFNPASQPGTSPMTNALLAGLTGLRANQDYLDVIGNNLANSNTPGDKSSRVTFSDILSQTLRPASAPTSRLGGTNPLQLGRGAEISSIDQNFSQGSLLTTGRTLDLGIQGNGFFVLSDGNEQFFSRVGSFGLDSQEY